MKTTRFEEKGCSKGDVLSQLEAAKSNDIDWRSGRLAVYVHFANDDVLDVSRAGYDSYFSYNALGGGAFPSLRQFADDIVGWTADIVGGADDVAGSVTSGGTESIFMAMKSARDWARATKPHISRPKVVVPYSAHPAFNKSAHYLNIDIQRVPIAEDFRADVDRLREAIDERTIMIAGSAPAFPHGVVDPIDTIAALAWRHDLWCHVDACVGGYIAPFARDLGYEVPPFGFDVPGVTSISADTHKYGFSAKGASVILFRTAELATYQVFEFNDWPRGVYKSPSFAGSRPGGAIASAWAVMRFLGREGYRNVAREIMSARDRIFAAVASMDELAIVGRPNLSVFAIGSGVLDIYDVAAGMEDRHWFTVRGSEPPCIHFGQLTGLQVPFVDDYIRDLKASLADAKLGRYANLEHDRSSNYGE